MQNLLNRKCRLTDLAYDLREHEGKEVTIIKHNTDTRMVEFVSGDDHIAVPQRCATPV